MATTNNLLDANSQFTIKIPEPRVYYQACEAVLVIPIVNPGATIENNVLFQILREITEYYIEYEEIFPEKKPVITSFSIADNIPCSNDKNFDHLIALKTGQNKNSDYSVILKQMAQYCLKQGYQNLLVIVHPSVKTKYLEELFHGFTIYRQRSHDWNFNTYTYCAD
jgi:hypothetical protein